jgi:hypothetical protein
VLAIAWALGEHDRSQWITVAHFALFVATISQTETVSAQDVKTSSQRVTDDSSFAISPPACRNPHLSRHDQVLAGSSSGES